MDTNNTNKYHNKIVGDRKASIINKQYFTLTYGKNAEAIKDAYKYVKILFTRKVDKVVKGGRNTSFECIVLIGNKSNKFGVGMSKGKTITDAITNAKNKAIKKIICPIPFKYIKYRFCATTVIIKKNSSNIIRAGATYMKIFEAFGVKGVSCKIIGSNNKVNCIFAIVNAIYNNIKFNNYKGKIQKEIENT